MTMATARLSAKTMVGTESVQAVAQGSSSGATSDQRDPNNKCESDTVTKVQDVSISRETKADVAPENKAALGANKTPQVDEGDQEDAEFRHLTGDKGVVDDVIFGSKVADDSARAPVQQPSRIKRAFFAVANAFSPGRLKYFAVGFFKVLWLIIKGPVAEAIYSAVLFLLGSATILGIVATCLKSHARRAGGDGLVMKNLMVKAISKIGDLIGKVIGFGKTDAEGGVLNHIFGIKPLEGARAGLEQKALLTPEVRALLLSMTICFSIYRFCRVSYRQLTEYLKERDE